MTQSAKNFIDIEKTMNDFEKAERLRLNLHEETLEQWFDPNPKTFTAEQRESTTALIGGLTIMQDKLMQAALAGLGIKVEVLDCPDTQALHFGKEFGNRGQCNPTYFTVGNLVKYLVNLRDEKGLSTEEIIKKYVFITAGACGPCRFGTYVTEYRKALRDAGFAGFRVLSFQQKEGLNQESEETSGIKMNKDFFMALVKGCVIGDICNVMGYRLRPYEIQPGQTDAVLAQVRDILMHALSNNTSILKAMYQCRKLFKTIKIDRNQAKPKVMIIGEFWAMTTEGAGNYHLQRFLESEGAEVDIQIVTAWLLYMLWSVKHDTQRRLKLREADDGRYGLANINGQKRLLRMWCAEKALRVVFKFFATFMGLNHYKLPNMDEIARLAKDHYDLETRGGEGHMEIGKVIQAAMKKKAHMVISVKPFGCMPSSGVSDGIQSLIIKKHPEVIFCPVETTGDGEVNFQSRILMFLFKAKRRAKTEFEQQKRHA